MNYWINTYHPLAASPSGPWTTCQPPLPPYVDASCRREPDLEAQRPAITGLCRTAAVKRLRCDDVVAYFTVKRIYEAGAVPHRRLTAVLRVVAEERSHASAARWYEQHGFPLPRNVMVPGNGPLPLAQTEGGYRDKDGAIVLPKSSQDEARVLQHWEKLYQKRRYDVGAVRICEPIYVNVCEGYAFRDHVVDEVFGKAGFPNTQWRFALCSAEVIRSILLLVGGESLAAHLTAVRGQA